MFHALAHRRYMFLLFLRLATDGCVQEILFVGVLIAAIMVAATGSDIINILIANSHI